MADSELVPLVPTPGPGTVGQAPKTGTVSGTDSGTPSLKSLAQRHLRRDRQRDNARDSLSHGTGTAEGVAGQDIGLSRFGFDCENCQFGNECAPNDHEPLCLLCGKLIAEGVGCTPAVIGGQRGRIHMSCSPHTGMD